MTKVEICVEKGRCGNKHCSVTSNQAWCDMNSNGNFLKIPDMCPNPRCKFQKQNTFTPKQFQLEGKGFKKEPLRNFQR